MTKATLKKEIKALVDAGDEALLLKVHALLKKAQKDQQKRSLLVAGVERGEADIAADRSMDLAEFAKRTRSSLHKRIASKNRPSRKG